MSRLQQKSASRCKIEESPGSDRTLLDGAKLINIRGPELD